MAPRGCVAVEEDHGAHPGGQGEAPGGEHLGTQGHAGEEAAGSVVEAEAHGHRPGPAVHPSAGPEAGQGGAGRGSARGCGSAAEAGQEARGSQGCTDGPLTPWYPTAPLPVPEAPRPRQQRCPHDVPLLSLYDQPVLVTEGDFSPVLSIPQATRHCDGAMLPVGSDHQGHLGAAQSQGGAWGQCHQPDLGAGCAGAADPGGQSREDSVFPVNTLPSTQQRARRSSKF